MENTIELAIVKGQSSGAFSLTDNGRIKIADDTDYEQWVELLRQAKWWHAYLEVGLSDIIQWGKVHFGPEKVNHELEQLEFEATMVKTAVAISDIPQEIRYPQLEGSHYVELAKANLKKADLLKWAKIAAEQGLTPMQLRMSIAEGEVIDQDAVKSMAHGVITPHGIRQQFDVWANRVHGVDGIMRDMDRATQEDIMEELEAIVTFGTLLGDRLVQESEVNAQTINV